MGKEGTEGMKKEEWRERESGEYRWRENECWLGWWVREKYKTEGRKGKRKKYVNS